MAFPLFIPLGYRLLSTGLNEPAGLVSDGAVGLFLFGVIWQAPRWLRCILFCLWFIFQIITMELQAGIQRLPTFQDVFYLFDLTFITNSIDGFYLTYPLYVTGLAVAVLFAAVTPVRRTNRHTTITAIVGMLVLLVIHSSVNKEVRSNTIISRYNPLHWLVVDAFSTSLADGMTGVSKEDLPVSLRTYDLEGQKLLGIGKAENVLIVVLEGISGLYIPEIRTKMNISDEIFQMEHLAQSTEDAMLVADFVTHGHQTIRGLYALHCGDFSKFSFAAPKAVELQNHHDRAEQCLPGWLRKHGWETHYLQAAGLQFMNKDRAMPAMGFQQVHGEEWFTERRSFDFIWGTTDADFFAGARQYINDLQKRDKPWLLSLLTVGTHQPFAVSDEMALQYGSRKIAAVAALDHAVADFINALRLDGVLEDTLMILTSDESHGAQGADWYSSWGVAAVLAPEQSQLPRQKEGTYGLVDLEISVLDYFGLPIPQSILGRSMFREYSSARDMVSYTGGKLRWHTGDSTLFECGGDGGCLKMQAKSIVGMRSGPVDVGSGHWGKRLYSLASIMDNEFRARNEHQVLQFADGEIRKLPAAIRNEWADNLIGAQYLDFPEKSKVYVDIALKAVHAGEDGARLKLTLRQFEKEVTTIDYPAFPVLHSGEEARVRFSFENSEARQAFSFHLVGEGENASVQFQKFEIRIEPDIGRH
ncbi:MAG: sulfatase-like hydrolase/transferase [Desulfopila sp.]|nr:sulfatase-like hydrolase/transferase [Desulfopila sp.]